MKQPAFSSHSRFTLLLAITASTWIAFAGVTYAESDSAPATAAPTNPPTATPSATPATDISQIPGAHITKTKDVITGLSIDDCKVLTESDFKLIRQTETLKTLSLNRGLNDAGLKILTGMPAIESFGTNGAGVTDAQIAATLSTFKNLQSLTFFHPGPTFTGTGLAALSVLPNLSNLTVAGATTFGDPCMAAVGQLSHLTAFRTWHGGVTLEGIKSLTSLKQLNNLTIGQKLGGKPPPTINDDAVEVLATIPSLQFLSLQQARLSLAALSKLSQIPDLKGLTLAEVDISESDINTLKQQLPKTTIKWTPPSPASQKWINTFFGPSVATGASGTPAPADAKNGN